MSPPPPIVLWAHGAGAGQGSPWMRDWGVRLRTLGTVVPFEYGYMAAGRGRPDPLPALVARHREALGEARAAHGADRPVVLAGKSMGSRVGCHVAAAEPVAAVICFGYPLLGAPRKDGSRAVRDEVLLALRVPTLFIQGTRDPLCPLEEFRHVRARMTAPNECFVVDGGNHSLEVPRRGHPPQGEVDGGVLGAIERFAQAALHPRHAV